MPRCEISISLYPRRTYYSSRETCRFFPVRTNEFVRVGHSRVTDDASARVCSTSADPSTHMYSIVAAWEELVLTCLLSPFNRNHRRVIDEKQQSRTYVDVSFLRDPSFFLPVNDPTILFLYQLTIFNRNLLSRFRLSRASLVYCKS